MNNITTPVDRETELKFELAYIEQEIRDLYLQTADVALLGALEIDRQELLDQLEEIAVRS